MKTTYNMLLVVKDLEKARTFYKDIFGLHTIIDYGANITLTGGLSLQSKETWLKMIDKSEDDIHFGGNVMEIYFEKDNFDTFIEKLASFPNIKYLQQVKEASWGQRFVRIYDEDDHIIEIGERMKDVVKRFQATGMNVDEIAKRMDIDVKYVTSLLK